MKMKKHSEGESSILEIDRHKLYRKYNSLKVIFKRKYNYYQSEGRISKMRKIGIENFKEPQRAFHLLKNGREVILKKSQKDYKSKHNF